MPDLVLAEEHEMACLRFEENMAFGELQAVCHDGAIVRGSWDKEARKVARKLCRIRDRVVDLGASPTRYGFETLTIARTERWVPTEVNNT